MSAYRTSGSVDGIGIEQRHPHGRIGLAMPPDSLSTRLRLSIIFNRSTPELQVARGLCEYSRAEFSAARQQGL
jgi:hypothetical protein